MQASRSHKQSKKPQSHSAHGVFIYGPAHPCEKSCTGVSAQSFSFKALQAALALQSLRDMIAISLVALLSVSVQATAEDAPTTSDVPVSPSLVKKPRVLPASSDLPPPEGYRAATRPHIPLVATGGGIFLTTWAVSNAIMVPVTIIGSLLGPCDTSTTYLLGFLPIVGLPLVEGTCTGSVSPLSVASSGLQLAGIGIALAGIIWPKHVWVLDKSAAKAPIAVSFAGQGLRLQF